jgi:hypothetical protein
MTQPLAVTLISKSIELESLLVPSARNHLRARAKESFSLRLLLAACAIERATAPLQASSQLLRRFSR